jgi:hypothetical protein
MIKGHDVSFLAEIADDPLWAAHFSYWMPKLMAGGGTLSSLLAVAV